MKDLKNKVTNTWVAKIIEKKGQAWVDDIAPKLLARHNTGDVHFAMWMERLNNRVRALIVMSYDDLEDWDYWSAYDGDTDPVEAANDMLSDLGYMMDEEY